jgi:hypothetical protein
MLLTSARGSYPGWSGAEVCNQVSAGSLVRLLEAHCERCPSIKVMVQFADCAVVVRLRVP